MSVKLDLTRHARPIGMQLYLQRVRLPDDGARHFQIVADAVSLLELVDLLPPLVVNDARVLLAHRIRSRVEAEVAVPCA